MAKIKPPYSIKKYCPSCGDTELKVEMTSREAYYLVGHLVGIHDFYCPNCKTNYELNGHIHVQLETKLDWTNDEHIEQLFEFLEKTRNMYVFNH